MSNDSTITPRTAISGIIDSDPQNLDETVRITRSLNRSRRSVSSRHGLSALQPKKSSKKTASTSKLEDMTPKSTILGFIGSQQDTEQTVRIQQRIPSSSKSPSSSKLSPRSSRRKSRQGNLLREATERSLRRNSIVITENPTPRTTIANIIGEADDETPVVPTRSQPVKVIEPEEPDVSAYQHVSFQMSPNQSEDGSYLSIDTRHSQSHSSISNSQRLRLQPRRTAFPPISILEEEQPQNESVQRDHSGLDTTEGRSGNVRGKVIGSFRIVDSREYSTISEIGVETGERNEERDILDELDEGANNQSKTQPEDIKMEDSDENDAQDETARVPEAQNEPDDEDMEVEDEPVTDDIRDGQGNIENRTEEQERSVVQKNRRTSERHWSNAIADLTPRGVAKDGAVDNETSFRTPAPPPPNKSKTHIVLESEFEDENDVPEGLPGFNSTVSKSVLTPRLVQTTLDSFGKIFTPVLPKASSLQAVPTPEVPSLTTTPIISQRASKKSVLKPKQVHPPVKRAKENVKKSSSKAKSPKAPPRLPRSNTASIFRHFVDGRVSNEVLNEVEKVADEFWKQMVHDLGAYAAHAKRSTVNASDVELLMKRQRLVDDKHTMIGYAEKYLPLEYQLEVIQVPKSGNVLVPK